MARPIIYKSQIYNGLTLYKGDGSVYNGNGIYNDAPGGGVFEYVVIDGKKWTCLNLDLKWDGLILGGGNDASQPRANYYNNDAATYGASGNKYGLLYNWTAVKYLEDNKETLIPGWRIPTQTDYNNLIAFVGGWTTSTNKKIKSTSGWSGDNNGTDDYGLSIVPSGLYRAGSFQSLGTNSCLWTIDEYNSGNSYFLRVRTTDQIMDHDFKRNGCSVRLIEDN